MQTVSYFSSKSVMWWAPTGKKYTVAKQQSHMTQEKKKKRGAAHRQYWSQLFKDICWIQFLSISTAKVLLEPRIGTLKKGSCGEQSYENVKVRMPSLLLFLYAKTKLLLLFKSKSEAPGATGHQWFCYLCILHPWCIKIPKVQNNIIIMPCVL